MSFFTSCFTINGSNPTATNTTAIFTQTCQAPLPPLYTPSLARATTTPSKCSIFCTNRPQQMWYHPVNRRAENDEEETTLKIQFSNRRRCHPSE